MMIVDDAMAVPLIDALDADSRLLPSLKIIARAGALLTARVRDRLRAPARAVHRGQFRVHLDRP
ncbi:MAG: hypothetical protein ACRDV2_04430 [Actinomycetes bacterium]